MIFNGFHHVGAGMWLLNFQTRPVLTYCDIITIGLLLKAVVEFPPIAQGYPFGEILLQDLVLQMPEAVSWNHFFEETDPGSCWADIITRLPLVENRFRDEFPSWLGVVCGMHIIDIFVEIDQRVSEDREDPCVYRILDLPPDLLPWDGRHADFLVWTVCLQAMALKRHFYLINT